MLESNVAYEDYLMEKEAYADAGNNKGGRPGSQPKETHKTIRISDDVMKQIAEEEQAEKKEEV